MISVFNINCLTFNNTTMKHICYKGDGTPETGQKIIDALIKEGASNPCSFTGESNLYYAPIVNGAKVNIDNFYEQPTYKDKLGRKCKYKLRTL